MSLNCVFGNQPGRRARVEDQVGEGQRFFAARIERDFHRVRVGEGRPALELVDLVLAHQEVDALDAPIGDLAAALEGFAVIEGDFALDIDAEFLGLVFEDMREFGVAQQRLRGDTADVEADAAPVLLLDNRRLQPKLAGADRRDITADTRAQHDDIVLFCHEGSS